MTLKDKTEGFDVVPAVYPERVSDNTAQVGPIIDLQAYASCHFAIAIGTLADSDATFDVKLDEGDDSSLSDASEVTSANSLVGTKSDFDFDDDDSAIHFGYRGSKRYVRLTITPSGNSGAADVAAVCILEKKKVGTL